MVIKVRLTTSPSGRCQTLSLARRGPAPHELCSLVSLSLPFPLTRIHHGIKGPAFVEFRPTPASIPPPNARYTLNTPPGLAVNFHPLVRRQHNSKHPYLATLMLSV
jgi:hypothetical protein